jgi:hypothetical protein
MGHLTFLLEFLTVYNYHNRIGKILSSQGKKKQNEASLSGSKVMIFIYPKSTFLAQKKLRTVMCTVKKMKMYLMLCALLKK